MADDRKNFLTEISVHEENKIDIDALVKECDRTLRQKGKELTVQNFHDEILRGCDSFQRQEEVGMNSAAISIAIEGIIGDEGLQRSIEIFQTMVRGQLGNHKYRPETLKAMIADDLYSTVELGPLRWKLELGYINMAIQRVMEEIVLQVPNRQYCDIGLGR